MSAFSNAVQKLVGPAVNFSNRNDTLAGIRWDTPGVTPPTQEAIDAELARQADPVPEVVPSGDFIRALHELGWIGDVKAAVVQASPLAQDLWAHASNFERNHELVIQIATAIGKDSEDLDELFRLAATY